MERIDIAGIALETLMQGEGPPILFLHGGDYVAQNQPFLDRLAHRWHVIAPRHPGFGNTPRPSWFRSVHDIAYLYLDLLDRLGLKFGGREEREIADIYALPAEEVLRRTFADPGKFVPDYAALDDAEAVAVAHDREATALYGWKPYMHDPALAHWLHRITRATLVLWGEQDGIAPPAYGEKLAAAIPHSRFHTIPGAAHYPQIEHPEAVAAAIGEITLPEIQR